jgi:hypothetical protein
MAYTRTLAMQRGITKLFADVIITTKYLYYAEGIYTTKNQALPIKRQALYDFKIEIQHECYTAENSK